jgi:hypothetical protein
MVKLQKVLAYKYKATSGESKAHYKYLINIPQEIVQQLGWKDGSELKLLVARGTLTVVGAGHQDH